MPRKQPYQPFYSQFITEIEKGFNLLDEISRAEVIQFLSENQLENGAFVNRAGTADLYYSLFGAWLSKATGSTQMQTVLKGYISTFDSGNGKVIDRFSHLLISLILEDGGFKKPSITTLISWIQKGGRNLNSAYRFFIFVLSFDALFGQNRMMNFVVRISSGLYKTPDDLPCSFFAALLMAKFVSGKNVEKETNVLMNYFEIGKGFKVFQEQPNADLLSTAVALFALKKSNAEIRLIAPDCLKLAEENYVNGAFLSGDGDSSRDLEYTFYGLLILGVLV